MTQISSAQSRAAGAFVDLVATRLGKDRGVHSETAIACTARLAGSLLLRSFNLNLSAMEPGSVVLSNEANEKGPQLINILAAFLHGQGVSLDAQKLGGSHVSRGEEPRLTILQTTDLLQDDALRIAHDNGLSLEEAAQAAALATAFIVSECSKSIGAEVGFNIATFGFIEGCKTVPTLSTSRQGQAKGKPWYRFW